MAELEHPTDVPSYGAPSVPPAATETGPSEPAKLGPFGRLVGVLLSPGETFQDISRKPTIVVPLIIGLLITFGGYYAFVWRANPDWNAIVRTQIRKRAEKSGRTLSDEELNRAAATGVKFAQLTPIILVVGIPIWYAILSGIFALAMILIGGKATYKKIFSVVAWVFASTGVVALIVTVASIMVQDRQQLAGLDPSKWATVVPTSLASFLGSDASPVVLSLAGWLDVFTIWKIILLSIGLAAIAGSKRITSGKTATIVVGVWVLGALIAAGFAAISPQ
jgi:hypothetical protein